MKIVNISGGLGNQMFQYAFAQRLKMMFPDEEVYVDISHYNTLLFKRFKGINLHNGYEIDKIFSNANLPVAGFKQLSQLSYYIPNYVLSRLGRKVLPIRKTELIPPYSMNYSFMPEVYTKEDCYYEGFWQCIRYYKEIKPALLNIFSHPTPDCYNKQLIEHIVSCNSVGIHVRRGDYLNEPEFRNICDLRYYKESIKRLLLDGLSYVFFVFSNDIQWCKENLGPLVGDNPIIYVTGNNGKNSCWDMFLMTYCKSLIIANSSFSWWGAFLNCYAEKVFAPNPWLNRNCVIDVYDDSWIRI